MDIVIQDFRNSFVKKLWFEMEFSEWMILTWGYCEHVYQGDGKIQKKTLKE